MLDFMENYLKQRENVGSQGNYLKPVFNYQGLTLTE